MELKLSWLLVALLVVLPRAHAHEPHNATETEMFSIPVTPKTFNWTFQQFDQQYRFHASLLGKPELPSWMRYIYSGRHHAGFVFGTPPRGTESPITLEVIGLNRQDYETRRVLLTLVVRRREPAALAARQIQLKIDNLNVEDLLDQHRMESLKEIFTSKLWPESEGQLYPTFLASAIDLGARLPLKPNEGEGLVVRLGSSQPFSSELRRLREEVRPLSRLASCPRDYKRTTVERLFRLGAFTLDWCSFKLFDATYSDMSTELTEVLDDTPSKSHGLDDHASYKMFPDAPAWVSRRRDEVPARSYLRELVLAVLVPVLLMLISVTALTAVLCFHYVGMPTEEHFFVNLFHLCEEYHRKRAQKTGRVELCRYGTGDTEQTQLADNTSNKSTGGVSPNNSLARPYSPKSTTNLAANYNRPQPPPYMGSNTNTLLLRRSGQNTEKTTPSTCSGNSPEHNRTTLALEESLQLLNEANIASVDYIDSMNMRNERIIPILKDPIIDLNDGTEDYVPLKPDGTGYVQMKPDLTGYIAIKPDISFGLNGTVGKPVI